LGEILNLVSGCLQVETFTLTLSAVELEKPSVGDLLVNPKVTFKIPPYQRAYGWQSNRWQALIQDILNKVTSPEKKHWVGIIITSQSEDPGEPRGYTHKYRDVIDGQQRIVTLRLWLQAILDHASENHIPLDDQSKIEFAEIVCQETDKQELRTILDGQWRSGWKKYKANSSGLLHCYTYFRWVLWLGNKALLASEPEVLPDPLTSESERNWPIEKQWEKELTKRSNIVEDLESDQTFELQYEKSSPPNLDSLIKATIGDLSLVELQLDKERDEEPAEIFEALNGKRLELEQFDHIRNFIFSGINDKEIRKNLYEEEWKHYEGALNRSSVGSKGADTFLYDYLISRGETRYQKSFAKSRTASIFVRYFKSRTSANHIQVSKKDLLPNLAAWISVKNNGELFEINNEPYYLEPSAKKSLRLMDALSSGPMMPILMNLTHRYFEGAITKESLQRQFFALEVLLGRTVLNRITMSPLRADMMALSGRLTHDFSEDLFINQVKLLLPKDSSIKEKLLPVKINSIMRYPESAMIADSSRKGFLRSPQMLAIFQAYESKKDGVLNQKNLLESDAQERFSIEHIYPQDDLLWRDEIRKWTVTNSHLESRLHTLGNLGVIPARLNSKLSNKSFREKKSIMNSPEAQVPHLRINEYWIRTEQEKWKPEDIDRRAEQILTLILDYWNIP